MALSIKPFSSPMDTGCVDVFGLNRKRVPYSSSTSKARAP